MAKPTLRIKEILKEKGLSMKNLQSRMGMNNLSALSQSISGNPTLERLQEIADALEVPLTDLFEKNEDLRFYVEYRGDTHEITTRDIIQLIDEPRIPDHENTRGKEYYK